ncbi:MAG: FKBP-type peptidyl-prolyl cis-trans isomerase [Bacteroidaceae bacterium]|nr:FKBP-type peptidyl-prolyl cis-trans isomerase [Bacteroidaceae bacterium]
MKTKFILFGLIAACSLNMTAAGKKKATKKKAAAQAVKVDTVCIDTFSYAAGLSYAQGLQDFLIQRAGLDTLYWDEFYKGLMVKDRAEADKKLINYVRGLEIREQLEAQIIPSINKNACFTDSVSPLNLDLVRRAFIDGAKNTNQLMTPQKAQEITQKQVAYYKQQHTLKEFGAYKKECEDFLAANSKKDSVVTLPSGVQYKVLREGNGPTPTETSTVKVNYEGRLIDGTVFETTFQRNQPAQFRINQVIKGWQEALTKMPIGSKWVVYIPQELAYGDQQKTRIKPFSALIFEIELLSIE